LLDDGHADANADADAHVDANAGADADATISFRPSEVRPFLAEH